LISVLQRVDSGLVKVKNKIICKIDRGFVIFLGISKTDKKTDADYLVEKIINLRVFNDYKNKMNLSIKEVKGSALIISQFTLCADMSKGRRPSFINAAEPNKAKSLYQYFIEKVLLKKISVETGEFGAEMKVELINNGPVTLVLDSNQV
jgi:D-tyrosyl-tRNA(Tyr) deacylase